MERKIGEVFKCKVRSGTIKLQVEEDNKKGNCFDCFFFEYFGGKCQRNTKAGLQKTSGSCCATFRSDNKYIIFKQIK